jgi:hypothetical protein
MLLEAMKDGKFPALTYLGLCSNLITPAGLRCFTEMSSVPALQRLLTLDLSDNSYLLDDLDSSTRNFVRSI